MSYTRVIELCDDELRIEQLTEGEEGCVVWDAALVLISYLIKKKEEMGAKATIHDSVLDLGSGTGVVGLALLKMGMAQRVTLSDRESQIPLLRRNAELNCSKVELERTSIEALTWDCEEEVARITSASNSYSFITASDCVYGDKSSACLAQLLSRLLKASPGVFILMSFEARDRHGVEVASGRDYSGEFFQQLREEFGCNVAQVPESELGAFHAPEISLYVISRPGTEEGDSVEGATAAAATPVSAAEQHLQAQRDGSRCACGCVPNVSSLFEMAQKRAEHHAKQKEKERANEKDALEQAQAA